jgi:hypothetical protein
VEIQYQFLCDYAQESGGKLTAVGIGAEQIYAPELPALHPSLALVVSLRYSAGEAGRKRLQVQLVDADGRDVMAVQQTDLTLGVPEGAPVGSFRIVVAMSQLKLEAYGDYAFHVIMDGSGIARVALSVVAPPAPE